MKQIKQSFKTRKTALEEIPAIQVKKRTLLIQSINKIFK